MKTNLVIFASLVALTGCGAAVRSPDMYRDDTQAAFAKKSDAMRACYDAVVKATPGAQGQVAISFDVETDQGKVTNVAVLPGKTTAPPAVADCVTKNIADVGLTPPDGNKGEATWVFDFVAPAPAVQLKNPPGAFAPPLPTPKS